MDIPSRENQQKVEISIPEIIKNGRYLEHWTVLQNKAKELGLNLSFLKEPIRSAGGGHETADIAADRAFMETEASRLQMQSDLGKQVRSAIERLLNGNYGKCLNPECEEHDGKVADIDSKRLIAIPWAEFCIGCQNKIEDVTNSSQPRKLKDHPEMRHQG
jgi:RNA polymerase-binding transcription factor DksA